MLAVYDANVYGCMSRVSENAICRWIVRSKRGGYMHTDGASMQ
jgi:hypothetical protein